MHDRGGVYVRRGSLQLLPTDVFERCVDEIAGMASVTEVHPFNNNEPLTDKRLLSEAKLIVMRAISKSGEGVTPQETPLIFVSCFHVNSYKAVSVPSSM